MDAEKQERGELNRANKTICAGKKHFSELYDRNCAINATQFIYEELSRVYDAGPKRQFEHKKSAPTLSVCV